MVSKRVFGSFSVDDLEKAKAFYEQTVGLEVDEQQQMQILHIKSADGGTVMVYPKPDHAPAVFTVLNLVVDDIVATVDELASKGVTFERYEDFKQNEKGIASFDGKSDDGDIAWFKDPAGNVVAVMRDWA